MQLTGKETHQITAMMLMFIIYFLVFCMHLLIHLESERGLLRLYIQTATAFYVTNTQRCYRIPKMQ